MTSFSDTRKLSHTPSLSLEEPTLTRTSITYARSSERRRFPRCSRFTSHPLRRFGTEAARVDGTSRTSMRDRHHGTRAAWTDVISFSARLSTPFCKDHETHEHESVPFEPLSDTGPTLEDNTKLLSNTSVPAPLTHVPLSSLDLTTPVSSELSSASCCCVESTSQQ